MTKEFRDKECDKKGRQKKNPLLKEELSGKKKLEEKVRKGKIHISPANKGNGMVAIPLSKNLNKNKRLKKESSWKT